MVWVDAVVVAAALVALAWGPGLCVAWAWRSPLGRVGDLAVAPAITLALAACAAVVAAAIGVRWSIGVLAVATGAACLPGVLVLRRRGRPSEPRPRPGPRADRRRLAVAAGIGLAFQLVPIAVAMTDPSRPQSGQDTVFHSAVLRWIRETGDASSLHVVRVADVASGTHVPYYPAAWHALTALLPYRPTITTAFNVSEVLLATVPWVVGALFLARVAFPDRPRTWMAACVVAGAAASVPVTIALEMGGLTPNAVGAALVPGTVAAVVLASRIPRWPAVVLAVAATVGTTLTHPGAGVAAVVLAAPAALVATLRRPPARNRRMAVWLVLALAVVGAAEVHRVTLQTAHPSDSASFAASLADALLARTDGSWLGAASLTTGVALVGTLVAWHARRARLLAVGAVLLLLVEVVVGAPGPLGSLLGASWYAETRRLAAPVSAGLVPFAAYALDRATAFARTRRQDDERRRGTASVVAAVAASTALVLLLPGVLQLTTEARAAFRPGPTSLVGPGEDALLARLPHELGSGTVLASPFSGASYLYAEHGVPVLPLSGLYAPTAASGLVMARLGDLQTDPGVCAALAQLGVRYLYVDQDQAWGVPDGSHRLAPPRGSVLVDSGGSASVYALPSCAVTG